MTQWILIGCGGHGRVLLATLQALGWTKRLLAMVDSGPISPALQSWAVPYWENDSEVARFLPQNVRLLNGLGSVADTAKRRAIYQRFRSQGYVFATLSHPSAWIADSAVLAEGVQVMAGAIVQSGCMIGENVLINSRAVVEHDCRIQDHVHIASGVVLCGDVWIGEGSHVGAGATVIQGIHIGANVCIGAGSVVVRDIPNDTKVVGVPAREMCK